MKDIIAKNIEIILINYHWHKMLLGTALLSYKLSNWLGFSLRKG